MKPITIIILLLALFSCSSVHNEYTPITKAAEARAMEFMNKIPQGEEKEYGFNDREEFANATLGEPIEVITLPGEVAHGTNMGKFVSTGEYRVPLEVNGEIRSFLTVSGANGEFKCVDFGAAQLAGQINAIGLSTGANNMKILRLYSMQIDYVVIGDLSDGNNLRFYRIPYNGGSMSLEEVLNEYENNKNRKN